MYIDTIVCLQGIPFSIITDKGTQFTFHYYMSFNKGLGAQAKPSTSFHPQMDGQAKHTIRSLAYMLRAYVIDFKGNWDEHLPLM